MVSMMGGTAALAWVIFVWRGLLAQESEYFQYQGRYLFPIVIPYAFLFVGGLERVCPARLRRHGAILSLLGLIWFDTLCLARYILPYFYS